jgi:hypothetical protein
MNIGLIEVREVDYQDKHFYLIMVKIRNMKVLTLGKYNEKRLIFEYYNYYTDKVETVDIEERKKLVGVFSIEGMVRDIEYNRVFKEKKW